MTIDPAKKGRGRTPGFRMSMDHRLKIKIANIISRLQKVALGEVDGSQVSVNAAIALLRKVLPDLSATQHSGDADSPLAIDTIITGVRRAGE
jgi:hypothetical protein